MARIVTRDSRKTHYCANGIRNLMSSHFDNRAAQYDADISEHVRLHLLKKKTDKILQILAVEAPRGASGIDLGCGTGHYLGRMSDQGYKMVGLEHSRGMAQQARKNNAARVLEVMTGSITDIPFADGSFHFAYAINVLHHLPAREQQRQALQEVKRVLKIGGLFFLHEMNGDSLLTRFYMNHIFPMTSRIDDDETEVWVRQKWIASNPVGGLEFLRVERFTFIPNLIPRPIFGLACAMERFMEAASGGRTGAHLMAVLRREPGP